MVEKTNPSAATAAKSGGKWNVPTGRRTDEWSQALVSVGESQDRAAFTRFFRHFAPLIKAFALSGSSLSATHADELVQEVMLKVWQKAGGFNPEKAIVKVCLERYALAVLVKQNLSVFIALV